MKKGLFGEIRDAVTTRAAALMLAVLGVQLAFVGSYVGAFHDPQPHRIPVAVVGPGPVAALNNLAGHPLDARAVPDEAAARRQIAHRQVYGALIYTGTAATDRLLVATAAGAPVAQVLTSVFKAALAGRDLTVEDVVPTRDGDARGLSGFYLVLGWVVGGYLVAIALSTSRGARPGNRHRAVIRLSALMLYAVLSGLGGALITTSVLGALSGGVGQLCWLGALLVFAAGAVTMALQALFGFVGVGLSVVLFVVLGNPSAGGAHPTPLLPAFWRTIGPWLPPGLGTDAVRGIAYFAGAGVARAAGVLGAYAVAGVAATLIASAMQEPRPVRLADLPKSIRAAS